MQHKLEYTIPELAEVSGIGLSSLYKEIKTGRLKAKKYGNKPIVTAEAWHEFVNSLPDYETGPCNQATG